MALWTRLRLPWRLVTHLSNRELLDALTPESSADSESAELTVDPKMGSHLLRCTACRNRSESLSAFLAELTVASDTTFGAAFPPERLATQRRRILRRLHRAVEQGPLARILHFPALTRPRLSQMSRANRWLAAAAVAGVVAGFGLGQLIHIGPEAFSSGAVRTNPRPSPQLTVQTATPPRGRPEGAPAGERATDTDGTFLDELELALSAPQVPQLSSLDELTPRIRDAAVKVW